MFLKSLKACVLILLIVSVILSLASCHDTYNDEYERKLADLIYQRQMLINEKKSLDSEMEQSLGNLSYMSFVFTELDSVLYTDVYPKMFSDDEIDIVGVMAFSLDELPGLDGKISVAQYEELMSFGWGSALYFDGSTEISSFVSSMSVALDELGIAFPKSVVFAKDTYSLSLDETLYSLGIENAVHNGEDDLNYIESARPDGVWHPGRIGWQWLGRSTKLKRKVEAEGGYAIFEINFDNSPENSYTSFFPIEGDHDDSDRVGSFDRMLLSFRTSIASGKIAVYNIEDTRDRVAEYYAKREKLEYENEIRRAELESQIDDITRRMTDLYNEYH